MSLVTTRLGRLGASIAAYLRHLPRDLVVNGLAASALTPAVLRHLIYRAYGLDISSVVIFPGVFFGSNKTTIGPGTFVNRDCFFDGTAPIVLGGRCDLGYGVMLVTSTHQIEGPLQRAGPMTSEKIVIGQGCWLGARVTVLPGVNIGPGCVIAAGSVVASDCRPGGLYAGVPATLKKVLD